MSELFSVGDIYNDFVVTKSLAIPEVHCHLTELKAKESGAEVLHLATDDPENFFCLSFRTLPESSNGIAHILEHTVLCGSKKYPVKDPFFAMNRRSLNTYMNALTGADFTCYPAASQVPEDFYNLLEVYLDAAFHPLLKETSFSQEGYRLEFATSDDPTTALQYKGIVYNEMKGSLSSPMTRLIEALNAELFSKNPYGYNSGGDPSEIPNLTYEQLLQFHKNHYHPSRCLFFFSGNLPLKKHLDFISSKALVGVKSLPELPPIPKTSRFIKPVYKELSYPIAPDETTEDKTMIAFAWLTCSILDQITLLALSVLDIVLMDTDASILKKELLASGLCKQAQAMMDCDIAEIPYGIIVKGANKEDGERLESIIFTTLEKLARDGIPERLIDNALHQLELFRSEITGDSAPFGLSLFSRSGLLKQHGGNAEDGLIIHSLFEELRTRISEQPTFLSDIITEHFCNNKHYVRLVFEPSHEKSSQEQALETNRLETVRKGLSEADIQSIITRAKELQEIQELEESEEDSSILPKINILEVPKKARTLALSQSTVGNIELFYHQTFTNNITYANVMFPIPETKEEDLWFLRLFTTLLPQMGCGLHNYQETLELIQENTGGIGAFLTLNHQVKQAGSFTPALQIRSKALYRKADKLFSILFDMITSPNFTDRKRLKELILKHYTNMQSTFVSNSLKYAMNLATSGINEAGRIHQAWYGLEYFYKVKELAQNIDDKIDSLILQLEVMKNQLLCTQGAHLLITCDQTELSKYIERGFEGLQDIPSNHYSPWKSHYQVPKIGPQGRIIASPVSFTTKVCPSIPYLDPDAAALSLAAFIFDNKILHKRIREQGGAYGGGSISSPMSGTFTFYSYRDPNIMSTLKAFDESVAVVAKGDFDEDDIEEAKLEMLQNLDAPISPGSRADVAYSWFREGKTDAMRQAFRDAIINMDHQGIKVAVQRSLLPSLKNGVVASFASKELLEKENGIALHHAEEPLYIEKIWV
jgi:Zn-dependent M16 (insulinase) family peptidase